MTATPPSRMGPVGRLLRWVIRGYQLVISPLLGPHCRHVPTCSSYAMEAIALHGALRGGWLALRRVLRCHPWGTSGYDPVPPPGRQAPRTDTRDDPGGRP